MIQTCSTYSDRFIINKLENMYPYAYSTLDVPFPNFQNTKYSNLIKRNLFCDNKSQTQSQSSQRIIASNQVYSKIQISTTNQEKLSSNKKLISPIKILDVPNIKDDFYLNLIDWHNNGPVGVALNDEVFVYSPDNTIQLAKSPITTYVSSLKFVGDILCTGISNGTIQIFDLQKNVLVRTLTNHLQRVSSITSLQNLLISGSKDKTISISDLRQKDSLIKSLKSHKGQVCTLKSKPNNDFIFASGSNDNNVFIWDLRSINNMSPTYKLSGHKGAVKAISWCPWKNQLLATGGGKQDKTIKIWGQNMSLIHSQKTKSQVSGLQWNQRIKYLISSHGNSQNNISFWKFDNNLKRKMRSKDHKQRILSLIQSKQQDMLCTLSGDQTLKFYSLDQFDQNSSYASQSSFQSYDFSLVR